MEQEFKFNEECDYVKKSRKLPIIIVLILILVIGFLLYSTYSEKPFKAIDVNEIGEIKVFAIPPQKEVVLSEDEVEKIIPLLQNLKTSKPGYKVPALAGQTVRITVQKTDGTIIEIFNVGNVQIIINGRSYRADYESAEAINNFANKILETGY